jgi:hypothetical protein
MNEKPILFSGPMIRAILEGRKTQTRRVVKPQPPEGYKIYGPEVYEPAVSDKYGNLVPGKPVYGIYNSDDWGVKCPYGRPGDQLWVRETFRWFDALIESDMDGVYSGWMYKANIPDAEEFTWKPSIHMPRHASRIHLEIIDIHLERLQYITDQDCEAEGVENRQTFRQLWDSINAKRGYSWGVNPRVWVIEFRRM